MSVRRFAASAFTLAALALSAANAATLAVFQSEPGDGFGDGQDSVLTDAGWTFDVRDYDPQQGTFSLDLRDLGPLRGVISLRFQTRPVEPLVGANQYMRPNPMGAANAVVSFTTNSQPCFQPAEGMFVAHEATGSGGSVDRLAIDFQFRCEGATGILRGQIRINSTIPAGHSNLTALANAQRFADEGEIVALNGQWSWAGAADISTYSWQQMSGPTVTLTSPSSAAPTFVAAAAPDMLSSLVFRLTVTDAAGNQSTDDVEMRVYSATAPQTYVALQGESDEFVLQGGSYLLRSGDVPMTWNVPNADLGAVELRSRFDIWFAGPTGAALRADNYENATRYGTHSPTGAGLTLAGDGRGCNTESGRFAVHEIEFDPTTGQLRKLAMDFERRCQDNAASPGFAFGQLRFNSTVSRVMNGPTASAGVDQLAQEASAVTLDATGSRAGRSPLATYQWSQKEGPTVALTGSGAATPTFTAPAVASGSVDLWFEVRVTDTAGLTDTDDVRVTVQSASQARNLLILDGRNGEFIGRGVLREFNDADGTFSIADSGADTITASFFAGLVNYGLRFRTPRGGQLIADNYENADQWHLGSPVRPGILVSGEGRACNDTSGRFVVRELVRAAGNPDVISFAADFEQYCDSAAVPLRGVIRYNSSIPAELAAPTAAAGSDQDVLERSEVVLDGGHTMSGTGTVSSWQWRQTGGPAVTLTDATQPVARFTPPRNAAAVQSLTFELTVTSTNSTQDTDTVDVRVHSKSSPRSIVTLDSAPGDFIGQGQDFVLLPQDGLLYAREFGQGRGQLELHWDGILDNWTFQFLTSSGAFAAGTYVVPEGGSGDPGISVSKGGGSCSRPYGRIDVRNIAFNDDDTLQSIAVDFEQVCDLRPPVPLLGKLRLNVVFPDAHAGADATVNSGARTTVSASQSVAAVGTIRTYEWTQVSGTAVTLAGADAVNAEVTAPASPATLVFRLRVTDDRGIDDTDTVVLTVQANPNPPPAGGGGGGGNSDSGGGGGALSYFVIAMLLLARWMGQACRRNERLNAVSSFRDVPVADSGLRVSPASH